MRPLRPLPDASISIDGHQVTAMTQPAGEATEILATIHSAAGHAGDTIQVGDRGIRALGFAPGRSQTARGIARFEQIDQPANSRVPDLLSAEHIENVAEMADFVAEPEFILSDLGFFCGDGGI